MTIRPRKLTLIKKAQPFSSVGLFVSIGSGNALQARASEGSPIKEKEKILDYIDLVIRDVKIKKAHAA